MASYNGILGEWNPRLGLGRSKKARRSRCHLRAGILLYGNESQTVGPEDAPAAVHRIMLGAEIVLLEGIVLEHVPEGVYFLSAAPLNLGGCDGAPCRAYLIDRSTEKGA